MLPRLSSCLYMALFLISIGGGAVGAAYAEQALSNTETETPQEPKKPKPKPQKSMIA